MARTFRSRQLAIMRRLEERMAGLFAALAAAVSQEIVRRADEDGVVPIPATYDLQRIVGARVMAMFLGRTTLGGWAPFQELPDGTVFPLSPYMRVLWEGVTAGVRLAVEQQANVMAQRLPPDLWRLMRSGPRVQEQVRVFVPNPLAGYDPPHLWVDPNGYRLSDRVWRVTWNARRRMDLFLEERIRQGQGALAMSKDLEQYLLPGRQLIRTEAPYGVDASYDAMRLARTENTRAHARAAEVSAKANPFVKGIEVRLSASHPKIDICDDAAAAGPWPKDQIPLEYQIPMHPHCLCSYQYVMTEDAQEIIDQARRDIERERRLLMAHVGPEMVDDFTRQLLSGKLQVVRAPTPAAVAVPVSWFTTPPSTVAPLGRIESGITQSYVLEWPDGTKALYKPGRAYQSQIGQFAANEHAEVTTYRVSQVLGYDAVPETVYMDVEVMGQRTRGSAMLWIENADTAENVMVRVGHAADESQVRQRTRMAMFDALINNKDRHTGNWLIGDDGRIWAIDHGLTFQNIKMVTLDSVIDPAIDFAPSGIGSRILAKEQALDEVMKVCADWQGRDRNEIAHALRGLGPSYTADWTASIFGNLDWLGQEAARELNIPF